MVIVRSVSSAMGVLPVFSDRVVGEMLLQVESSQVP